jgi:hypothetical protein
MLRAQRCFQQHGTTASQTAGNLPNSGRSMMLFQSCIRGFYRSCNEMVFEHSGSSCYSCQVSVRRHARLLWQHDAKPGVLVPVVSMPGALRIARTKRDDQGGNDMIHLQAIRKLKHRARISS